MSNQQYNPGSQRGAFMGAHFAMDEHFHLTANIKRNYIHALLHFAHTKKVFIYTLGMSYEDCFADNQDFFLSLIRFECKLLIIRDSLPCWLSTNGISALYILNQEKSKTATAGPFSLRLSKTCQTQVAA